MPRFVIVISILLFAVPVMAERVSSDDPRVQRRIDKFYKYLDRAQDTNNNPDFRAHQLSVAERNLAQLRRKKAAGIAKLEQALEKARRDIAGAKAGADQARKQASHFSVKMQRIIRPNFRLNWTSAKDNGPIRKSIREYRQLADELAGPSMAPVRGTSPMLKSYCVSMVESAKRVPKEEARYRAQLKRAHHPDPVHNEIMSWQARYYAASRLCPGPGIASAYRRVAGYVKSLGGLDGARRVSSTAKAGRAAKVRMAKAVVRDKKLAGLFRQVFRAQKWNEPIRALRITSAGWDVVRHRVSGKIIGRTRTAQIAVSQGSACRLYDFTIYQPKTGRGFGAARRHVHGSRVIACANIPSE